MTLITMAVTLADIAKHTRTPVADVRAECQYLGIFVGSDWAGRPAVSVEDAAGLASGNARRDHDERAAWLRHQVDTEQWERDREKARRDAFNAAFQDYRARGRGEPAAAEQAREDATQAVLAFQRTTPPPMHNGQVTTQMAVGPESKGVLASVAAHVAGMLG